MFKYVLEKLFMCQNLTETEITEAMTYIMEGLATPTQIGAFLASLKIKGETLDEITGSAKVMRDKAINLKLNQEFAVDTCGTGGDGSHTFNISTIVALITAAAGIPVVKHGNRSVSSKCGSADLLEQLGVNINLTIDQVKRSIDEANFGFLFAPNFHQAMHNVARSRQELGVRTIFNLLGPLTNPAQAQGQVLGVYALDLVELLAKVLQRLGCERALVVHGLDGLDEITITTQTQVSELDEDGKITSYLLNPLEYGLSLADPQELIGGSPADNAQIAEEILNGALGPKRDIVLLNSGASLYVGKLVDSIGTGIEYASYLLDSGLAKAKLQQVIELSNQGGNS